MTNIELLRNKIELDVFDYNQLMSVLSDYRKPRDVIIWSKDFFRAAAKQITFVRNKRIKFLGHYFPNVSPLHTGCGYPAWIYCDEITVN